MGDLSFCFCHGTFGPESTATGDGAPLAGDVIGFDVGAYGSDIAELK